MLYFIQNGNLKPLQNLTMNKNRRKGQKGCCFDNLQKILLIVYDLFIPIFADKHCDEFFSKVKNRVSSPCLSVFLTLLKTHLI